MADQDHDSRRHKQDNHTVILEEYIVNDPEKGPFRILESLNHFYRGIHGEPEDAQRESSNKRPETAFGV